MEKRRKPVPAGEENAQKNRFGKKAKPSSENGMPIMAPAFSMNLGHNNPSSKERTVPEIAPTANRMAEPRAQRFAARDKPAARSKIQSLGDRHQHRHSDSHRREDNVEAQRHAHLRTGKEKIVHACTIADWGRLISDVPSRPFHFAAATLSGRLAAILALCHG